MSEKLLNNIKNITTVLNITNKLLLRDLYLKKFNKKYQKTKKILNLLDNNINVQLGGSRTQTEQEEMVVNAQRTSAIEKLKKVSTKLTATQLSEIDIKFNNTLASLVLTSNDDTTIKQVIKDLDIEKQLDETQIAVTSMVDLGLDLLNKYKTFEMTHLASAQSHDADRNQLSALEQKINEQTLELGTQRTNMESLNKQIVLLKDLIKSIRSRMGISSAVKINLDKFIKKLEEQFPQPVSS